MPALWLLVLACTPKEPEPVERLAPQAYEPDLPERPPGEPLTAKEVQEAFDRELPGLWALSVRDLEETFRGIVTAFDAEADCPEYLSFYDDVGYAGGTVYHYSTTTCEDGRPNYGYGNYAFVDEDQGEGVHAAYAYAQIEGIFTGPDGSFVSGFGYFGHFDQTAGEGALAASYRSQYTLGDVTGGADGLDEAWTGEGPRYTLDAEWYDDTSGTWARWNSGVVTTGDPRVSAVRVADLTFWRAIGDACPSEITGAVAVRGVSGDWVELRPVVAEAAKGVCELCGPAMAGEVDLGEVCFPFSALFSGGVPW